MAERYANVDFEFLIAADKKRLHLIERGVVLVREGEMVLEVAFASRSSWSAAIPHDRVLYLEFAGMPWQRSWSDPESLAQMHGKPCRHEGFE